MQDIGDRIKSIRLSREISTRKASAIAGIAPSYWSAVELGHKSPSLSSLEKIAEALDVRLIDLVEPDEETQFSWFYELPGQIQTWLKDSTARESMEAGEFIHRHGLTGAALKGILLSLCHLKYYQWRTDLPQESQLNPRIVFSYYEEIDKLFGLAKSENYLIKTEGGKSDLD